MLCCFIVFICYCIRLLMEAIVFLFPLVYCVACKEGVAGFGRSERLYSSNPRTFYPSNDVLRTNNHLNFLSLKCSRSHILKSYHISTISVLYMCLSCFKCGACGLAHCHCQWMYYCIVAIGDGLEVVDWLSKSFLLVFVSRVSFSFYSC